MLTLILPIAYGPAPFAQMTLLVWGLLSCGADGLQGAFENFTVLVETTLGQSRTLIRPGPRTEELPPVVSAAAAIPGSLLSIYCIRLGTKSGGAQKWGLIAFGILVMICSIAAVLPLLRLALRQPV
jgi:hypothetical protein